MILGLPGAVVQAARDGERDSVVQAVPKELDEDDADPVAEGECGVLLEGEPVASGRDGLLEPDGGERIDPDVETEGDEGEDAHDNCDGTDADENRGNPNFDLCSLAT